MKVKTVSRRGWLHRPRVSSVLVELAAWRSVRLGLVVIVSVALLWLMLLSLANGLAAGAALPPDLAGASLRLDAERLGLVINSRAARTEQQKPPLGQYAHLFARSPALPAASP